MNQAQGLPVDPSMREDHTVHGRRLHGLRILEQFNQVLTEVANELLLGFGIREVGEANVCVLTQAFQSKTSHAF